MFTLDKIKEILGKEADYIQRYQLRYYIHEHVPEDERDPRLEGVVCGLEKAISFLEEASLSRRVKLTS